MDQHNTMQEQARAAGLSVAINALQFAATNAAQPGTRSSEWRAVVGGALLTASAAVLHALAVIPGPWMLPAIAVSTGISVGAYAISRGSVKAAALAAAAAVVRTAIIP